MSRRRQKRKQDAFWSQSPGLFDLPVDDEAASELVPLSDNDLRKTEPVRFLSFGSGSSGNCSYIGTRDSGLLIDAGVNNNYVEAQLAANSINPDTIAGILLTHDHSDHVRYAYAILRRHRNMKLFATAKAFNGLLRRHSMSRRIKDYHNPIFKEFPFKAGNFTVTAFETSHDGTDNAGFFIEGYNTTFTATTDTGVLTSRADEYIRKSRNLMIESNYDLKMLRNGHYPQHLKARIESTIGHLDNADTARYLASVANAAGLKHVVLCHLSNDNNTPQIALTTVRDALEAAGIAVCGEDSTDESRLHLSVLPREVASLMITLATND